MERKNYSIAVYSALAIVFVFFIAFRFFNISVDRQLAVQMHKEEDESMLQELKVTREEESKVEKEIAETNALAPYAIKVQKQSALLENQHYWDSNTQIILGGTDILQRLDDADAFTGNKMTSEQFEQQLRMIDGRINEYARKVQADPADDYAREKLQSLYMLKATVNGLKESVIEK